jgi:protease YdgD
MSRAIAVTVAVCLAFARPPSTAARSLPGLAPTSTRVEVDRTQAPWAALGRVQTEFAERCTGFQLAPALVATAAHCFYLPKVANYVRPHEIHFLLGEHLDTYVEHARAIRLDVAPGYRPTDEAATAALDRAFIVLDHPTHGLVLHIATAMPPPGTRVMLGGYGQDRQERILADTACRILSVAGGLIRHDCAATRGTSGAPLLAWQSGAWRVIGIQIEAELNGQGGVAASLVPQPP